MPTMFVLRPPTPIQVLGAMRQAIEFSVRAAIQVRRGVVCGTTWTVTQLPRQPSSSQSRMNSTASDTDQASQALRAACIEAHKSGGALSLPLTALCAPWLDDSVLATPRSGASGSKRESDD